MHAGTIPKGNRTTPKSYRTIPNVYILLGPEFITRASAGLFFDPSSKSGSCYVGCAGLGDRYAGKGAHP